MTASWFEIVNPVDGTVDRLGSFLVDGVHLQAVVFVTGDEDGVFSQPDGNGDPVEWAADGGDGSYVQKAVIMEDT